MNTLTYPQLYRERQNKKAIMKRIKPDRSQWRLYVQLSEEVKEMTKELKELAKVRPEFL